MKFLILTLILCLSAATIAYAKPSGNMAKTTRFYGASGYVGSARVYEYGNVKRSFYYNSKGSYLGQSIERK